MASKFGLAGGLPERRVRPIWDAIDSRQYKNALKAITTLLAKYPNAPYVLALKALVLERMGKPEEALSVCLSAKEVLFSNDSFLTDDLTLSTLQSVFQRLDHMDFATSCYEYACGKFPNHLDLMMGLFNCYVRENLFVKQQQTAIKMYKLAGEERFLLWAVCSIQLQVHYSDGGEKLLLLAEGLLKKHIASHSLHEPEAIMVYISILEQQAKYGDALEVLTGKLGSLLTVEVDRLRIQGRLLARAGDFADAANIFQKILELRPDDWECFLHYLGCLLEDDSYWCTEENVDPIHPPKKVLCKISPLSDELFDSRISDASAVVQKLQEDSQNKLLRGLFFANLEIERRKHMHGKGNDEKLLGALTDYWVRFGHLACFASDVEMFVEVLAPDKKTELLENLKKITPSASIITTKALGQSMTLLRLQVLCGNMFHRSDSELEHCAVQMAEIYCKNLPLSKDLDPQESMHGEEILSLICNLLVELFWRTQNFGYIIEAILVLEWGLTIGRYAYHYKILLLHLYSYLGAFPMAYEWYKCLDVKNILVETATHHILPQMLVSPLWVGLSNLLKDYLKFMDDHLRESAEHSFLAYRHRNYSKVVEFVQFKERLQNSSQYLVAKVEESILRLKQHAHSIEEEEAVLENLKSGIRLVELSNEIPSKPLTFNEDFQSRPWWTPTSEKNYLLGPHEEISYRARENLSQDLEAGVRRNIERRSLLPRMLFLSVRSVSTSIKENFEINGSLSDPKISTELKNLLERYAKMLGSTFENAVDLVTGVSDGLSSYKDFGTNLVEWFNFAVFLNAWNLSSGGCRSRTWHIVDSLLEKYILEGVASLESTIFTPYENMRTLVQVVSEPLAWHGLILQACVRSSLPSGKRKKKTGSAELSSSPLYVALRDSTQSLCSTLESLLKWLIVNQSDDGKLEAILSSMQNDGNNDGPGQVFQILETSTLSMDSTELGHWITGAFKCWNTVKVARKLVTGKHVVLNEFIKNCESKFKSVQKLKQQLSQI
ncbi:N-terminal acetyltransferase B complex auxiliary subunit NAA25-like isoform X1 [Cucurbita pepo subsp. pepo]|uniref:N-terminal acetyltransferase B complex auxiliary subunit NAA25-like isoform X1 n=2 Tax=Cucurbita pepo subsp. pepo TaxID=3664 RepID=UPI000C9D5DA7|nr:N-terminal acetyltransferase B complex auxiliary subunit NAA25-like isoform X1 [Cucurbita pepo subsp. pepo]